MVFKTTGVSFAIEVTGLVSEQVFGHVWLLFVDGAIGLVRGAVVLGQIKGRILEEDGGGCILDGLGFAVGNAIGNGTLDILAL